MGKSVYLKCLLACALSVSACKSDETGDGGAGTGNPTAGMSGGMAGKSGVIGMDPDPINNDCPQKEVGPKTGDYAQKGACCYRKSNTARKDANPTKRTLEYRMNYFFLVNNQKTVDPAVFGGTLRDRVENEEQSYLMRIELPLEGGKVVDGAGTFKWSVGRYNCDGTYSYYDDKAADTTVGTKDPARWAAAAPIPIKVTAAKTDKERFKPVFKDALKVTNEVHWVPTLGSSYTLDYDFASQGTQIPIMPETDDVIDCIGSRKDSNTWKPGGQLYSYLPVEQNDNDQIIDTLQENFSQLFAFGTGGKTLPVKTTARCTPGSTDCKWVRLPDSLCPTTDADKGKWGCHLGYEGNPDNPVPTCTKDVPANVDTDMGATTDGQCCDPLGGGKDGLPTCNAWLSISDIVAAAADITDAPVSQLQQHCTP